MKAAVYGSEIVASRVRPILAEYGFEIIAFSGELGSDKLDYLLENLDEMRLAIVDTLEEHADSLCGFLGELEALPVVLLIDYTRADWEKFCSFEASAFVPHSAGEMEFASRLKKVIAGTIAVTGIKTGDEKEN